MYFNCSTVCGPCPKVGDRVNVRAKYDSTVPIKWHAKTIQKVNEENLNRTPTSAVPSQTAHYKPGKMKNLLLSGVPFHTYPLCSLLSQAEVQEMVRKFLIEMMKVPLNVLNDIVIDHIQLSEPAINKHTKELECKVRLYFLNRKDKVQIAKYKKNLLKNDVKKKGKRNHISGQMEQMTKLKKKRKARLKLRGIPVQEYPDLQTMPESKIKQTMQEYLVEKLKVPQSVMLSITIVRVWVSDVYNTSVTEPCYTVVLYFSKFEDRMTLMNYRRQYQNPYLKTKQAKTAERGESGQRLYFHNKEAVHFASKNYVLQATHSRASSSSMQKVDESARDAVYWFEFWNEETDYYQNKKCAFCGNTGHIRKHCFLNKEAVRFVPKDHVLQRTPSCAVGTGAQTNIASIAQVSKNEISAYDLADAILRGEEGDATVG